MTSLQRLIKDRLAELDRTMREAARLGGISAPTISAIVNGKHGGKLTADTIEGLAKGLSLPSSVVAEAAGRYAYESPTEFVLPDRAGQLTAANRKVVMDLLDSLLRAQEAGGSGQQQGRA